MVIEVRSISIEGSMVHVTGMIDGREIKAKGAAYPYRVGKSPVHKRRYLEQLLTAAVANEAHRDNLPDAGIESLSPESAVQLKLDDVNLPESFVAAIDALSDRLTDHNRKIFHLQQQVEKLIAGNQNQANQLRGVPDKRTFWQRIKWILRGE
jgi:hypothetical protein